MFWPRNSIHVQLDFIFVDLADCLERLTANDKSRNSHGFYPSILRHSGIWGLVDEPVLKKYIKNNSKNTPVRFHIGISFAISYLGILFVKFMFWVRTYSQAKNFVMNQINPISPWQQVCQLLCSLRCRRWGPPRATRLSIRYHHSWAPQIWGSITQFRSQKDQINERTYILFGRSKNAVLIRKMLCLTLLNGTNVRLYWNIESDMNECILNQV